MASLGRGKAGIDEKMPKSNAMNPSNWKESP
jgi:hypothetical protein